ncbi:Sir2 family NAD-dependent protein deacetylase, partial [Robiginitalea biformata]|uniref:Sir2 family NAD-dependent protein deacetylase n=1 Tax=Robiginitalea biformata TaxID=252307 RepID=UPI003D3386FA
MKRLVVLSGAGMSGDSGIRTFREAGGLWEGHPVEQVGTPEGFGQDPRRALHLSKQRRRQASEVAQTNADLA